MEPNEPDDQLKSTDPAAWKEAQSRLYEHFKSQAKEFPDTIEEMAPLYAAVVHGCHADRHQEALDEVFKPRIQRGDEFFSLATLGAFDANLAALAGFFDEPWEKPVAGLRETDQSYVLSVAGYNLRALGRLAEAAQPMKASLTAVVALEDLSNAAIQAGHLSELHLTLGDLAPALDFAQQGVEYADRGRDAFWRMVRRTTLANTHHQAGRIPEAVGLFQMAENMQKFLQPQCPLLYSVRGFQYCDLLLGQGKCKEVLRRSRRTLKWVSDQQWLQDIALDHLSLGRAHLLEADAEAKGKYSRAAKHLDQAVAGLRQAGQQDYFCRGLLTRAELHRVRRDFDHARRDLDEAMLIATRGGMRLFQADCHLEYARLHLAQGDKTKARESWTTARAMITEMGYLRRAPDLAALEQQLLPGAVR